MNKSAKPAWSFVDGAWKETNRAEAYAKAQLIGELEFRRLFGELPPLPAPINASLRNRAAARSGRKPATYIIGGRGDRIVRSAHKAHLRPSMPNRNC